MNDYSEREIIEKIKQGEINYFEYLVNKYSKVIYYYAFGKLHNVQDAEDIVQDTFLKAYKAIDKFDAARPFYPYLFSILKNEINTFFRKRRPTIELTEESATFEEVSYKIEFDLLFERIRPEYSRVLQLYYLDGLSYKEISQKIQKPLNTVKTIIRRAKQEVKTLYEEHA